MPSISAVVNIRNEERNISKCLDCLTWCDEIVVVDMESEDKSAEIARSYTSKVFSFPKVGYVEPARKFAVEQATGDWVLIVDADELIPVSLKKQLISLVEKNNDVDVVYIPRKNHIMGDWIKHTGWWPDYQARFFKNGKITFSDKIHSEFIKEKNANIFYLPAVELNGIEHFAYLDSVQFISKLNAYTTIEAKHLLDNNVTYSNYKLLSIGMREIYNRFIKVKGYKDGHIGFFLSLMMGFYRMLTYIKLWELRNNANKSVDMEYKEFKSAIGDEYTYKNKN